MTDIKVTFNNRYAFFDGGRTYYMTQSSYSRIMSIWKNTAKYLIRSWTGRNAGLWHVIYKDNTEAILDEEYNKFMGWIPND